MSLDTIQKPNENNEELKIKIFDLNDYINKGIIEPFDKGGTHSVFKYKDYVIKIKKDFEFDNLEGAKNFLLKNKDKVNNIYETEKEKDGLLKKYFSNFEILEQAQFIRVVELDGKFYPTIIKGQKYDEDFSEQKENVLDFSSEYIDIEDIKKSLNGEKLENENNKFNNIKQRINDSENFRDSLIKFISSFKTFFNETGKFMDFMGQKNCIFVKDEESGNYKVKIGTIIKNSTIETYNKSLAKLQNGEKIIKEDENNIKNGFSNLFFINSLIEELNKYEKIEKIEI